MEKSGFVEGKHFTDYVETVRDLIRERKLDQAIALLLRLVEATEDESKKEKMGVAPWYYEQLAIIYRKQKQLDDEIEILERFAKQRHARGVKPARLISRLDKIRKNMNDCG